MEYEWRFDILWQYRYVFLLGVGGTLSLTGLSMLFGLIFGIPVGIGRMSNSRIIKFLSGAFIEVFRDTPILVQLVWIFYCLPILTGIMMSAFMSAILAMSLHATAYLAEVYRAGIASIDRGQIEAGRVVGMSSWQTMRRIILPQAIQRVIPPMMNVFADFMKASALCSVIGVWELFREASNVITTTYRPLEVYSAMAVIYFLIIYPVVWAAPRLEALLARRRMA
jgi:polar amino acid transport system permease protein